MPRAAAQRQRTFHAINQLTNTMTGNTEKKVKHKKNQENNSLWPIHSPESRVPHGISPRCIMVFVLSITLPFIVSAQQLPALNTLFPKTDKDTITFRDSSWSEADKGTICKYAGAGWRSLMVSGRLLLHITPGPTKFEINLYPHKLIIAPNQAADVYIYSRNFRLITACVISGKADWVYKTTTTPLTNRAGIYRDVSGSVLDVAANALDEYKNWSKGIYLFDDITVPEFAAELSKKYGVFIEVNDPTLKDHRIHTAIDSATSLLTMLNRLSLILHLSYTIDIDNTIRLKTTQDKK